MELPRDLRMRRGGASFDPSTNTWELERQLASPVRIDANTDQVLTLGLMVADLPPKAGMMGFLPVDSHRADYLSPEGSVVLLTTANVLDYTLAVNGGSTVGLAQAVSNLPVEMEFFTNQRLALIPFPPPGRPAADANDRPPTTLTLTTSLSETLVRRERCAGESVLRSECREDGDGEGRLVSYLASGGVRFGAAGSCTLPQPTDVVQRECVGGVFMNTQRDGTIVPGGSCTVDSIPQPPSDRADGADKRGGSVFATGGLRWRVSERYRAAGDGDFGGDEGDTGSDGGRVFFGGDKHADSAVCELFGGDNCADDIVQFAGGDANLLSARRDIGDWERFCVSARSAGVYSAAGDDAGECFAGIHIARGAGGGGIAICGGRAGAGGVF